MDDILSGNFSCNAQHQLCILNADYSLPFRYNSVDVTANWPNDGNFGLKSTISGVKPAHKS